MGKQIAVTRSSRDGVMKKADGGLAMLSPAAALAKSLQSGRPEGLMKLTPIGAAINAAKGKTPMTEKDKAKQVAPTAMKSGGKVGRGCGCAMRGKGKGRMV